VTPPRAATAAQAATAVLATLETNFAPKDVEECESRNGALIRQLRNGQVAESNPAPMRAGGAVG